jgi:hypothetical protein
MNSQPLPTEDEWRARFKARLIARGTLPGIADDIEQNVVLKSDMYDYTLDDSPEQAADDEMTEWDNDEPDEDEDNAG